MWKGHAGATHNVLRATKMNRDPVMVHGTFASELHAFNVFRAGNAPFRPEH